ncbi:MAG: glycine cleavage system aminomethyltransferase GcvT [Bryobacteraceae bacterium]
MTLDTALKQVPLHAQHLALGAKMVPFAGYAMPVQYSSGVLKEHLHTRAAAGLFDVSHMGQILVRPRSGKLADAALALERLVPADILSLVPGRQRYALFTVAGGGISDDLMIANFRTHFLLVVNASRKAEDEALLRAGLEDVCEVEPIHDRALLAIQGPRSEAILATLAPSVSGMKFMDAGWHSVMGIDCMVSRSGYTGEDGFELSVPEASAGTVWDALLQNPELQPIGLGARDSLRLEAGLCLYGNDIDLTTNPAEASLNWSIQKSRKLGGERAGGFPGADVILPQLQGGAARRMVGLRPENRPVRGGATLFASETSTEAIGRVTSGGFGPTVNGPVSMGYVDSSLATPGTRLFAEVRSERTPIVVASLPFVAHSYKR